MADPKKPDEKATSTGKKKISLMEKLLSLSLLQFSFIGVTMTKDRDKNMIAILTLAEPIPHVRGSQEVEWGGKRVAVNASDVKEIKVHQRSFEGNPDFEFDPDTDTGSYKGSKLTLDVSKSGQVWLTEQSFAAMGGEFRNNQRTERLGKLLGLAPETAKAPADKALEPTE